jgi:cell division protein ZapA (FtsZ GTPase activity inhibitor)
MTSAKSSVTVRIAGEEHTIRASAEPAYTRKCAELVDDRIHRIRLQAGLIEGHKAAILAALSIADECFQAQEELTRLRADVAQRAAELARRIEGAVEGQATD